MKSLVGSRGLVVLSMDSGGWVISNVLDEERKGVTAFDRTGVGSVDSGRS